MGPINMVKAAIALVAVLGVFVIQGCHVGEITPEQQQSKIKGMEKFAEDHGTKPVRDVPK